MSALPPRDGFDSLYGTLRPALVTIDELVAPWADLKIDLPREAIVRITFKSFLQLALALDYVGKLIEITGLATYDADGVPLTMTEVLQWQPVPARTDDELLRDAMEWVANLAPVAAEPEEEPDDDLDGTPANAESRLTMDGSVCGSKQRCRGNCGLLATIADRLSALLRHFRARSAPLVRARQPGAPSLFPGQLRAPPPAYDGPRGARYGPPEDRSA